MNETAVARFRAKFAMYRQLAERGGDAHAWQTMLIGYPERQKARMGAYIDSTTLAAGFTSAIPSFARMGMDMAVVDISTPLVDAALEIQRTCPVLELCHEYGLDTPCRVICEMDVAATLAAFPGMRAEILSRQAEGACVCIFKYERAAV